MVSYDSSVSETPTGGPDLYAHSRTNFDGDATWTKLMPFAVTVGYSHNANGYDARIIESAGENVFRVSADAVGSSWLTFRTQYEYGDRTGSGLDETQLTAIGEHPEMRHYDLADRTRNRFTAQADIVPSDAWTFSVSGGVLKDNFNNSFYGLQDSTGRTFSLAADFHGPTASARAAATTTSATPDCSARTRGIRPRRSSTIRCATGPPIRPRRCTTSRSTPTRRASGRTLRSAFSYDFSHAEGNYLYTIPAGSPIPAPNQLPNVFNKLQQLHLDVRYRLSSRLAALVLVPVRAAEHLRLRVRPERGQRHRAAELAGHGLRVSALHRQLGGVRPPVSLVSFTAVSFTRFHA